MPVPAIEFRDVSFTRPGGLRVLDRFSLTVESGNVLALVGRSGAGKTTVLKLVNRLLLPDAGAVLVEGRDTREWEPIRLRRRVGFVLQDVGLFPHLNVAANVGVVPRLEGWPPERVTARVRELLDQVGLPPGKFLDRYPRQLSGGQRQRVGVARALAADPRLMLLDEPFGALDPVTRLELQDQFLALRRQFQKTSIFVTHDVREALMLGSRIALMDKGHIVLLETPAGFVKSENELAQAYLETLQSEFAGD